MAKIMDGGVLRDARPGELDPPNVPPDRRIVPLGALAARIAVSGKLSALVDILDASPETRALLMSLQEGIYADDQQARALLTAAGLDPDEVLR